MTNSRGAIAAGNPRRTTGNRFTETAGHEPWSFSAVLAAIWIGGACCTAAVHAVRIRRFASVIRDSEPAPPAIRTMVARLSSRLGLRRVPDVLMTSRALPPLVWSIGLFPRVILPSELFARLRPRRSTHDPRPRTLPYPARRPSRPAPRARGDHGLLVASRRVVGKPAVARARRTVLRRPRPRTRPRSTADVRRRPG